MGKQAEDDAHNYVSSSTREDHASTNSSTMRSAIKPQVLLIGAVGIAVLAAARPGPAATSGALCNSRSSLTLIYQNNLNVSDACNHASAIVLDNTPPDSASVACQALNEQLLSQATVQNYSADFADSLAYLDWKYHTGASYLIDSAILTLKSGELSISSSDSADSQRPLPVICTQSSLEYQPENSTATTQSQLSVFSGGNTYLGYRNAKSFRFLGIPYANSPNRFEYPTVYSGKGQTVNATAYGSQCLQGGGGSEDCLFLNIQTPYLPHAPSKPFTTSNSANLRPVFFWIHGGGFTGGTGSDPGTDGGNFASREDIVTVTINYRLSTLGFLAIPGTDIKGNYGIGDQITALQWVATHIADFGGDPNRITIGGSSAGAGSVRALLGSPKAIPLFQGAMMDSNLGGGVDLGLDGNYGTTYSRYLTIEESFNRSGIAILNATDCLSGTTAQQITCLKTANATTLITGNDVARYVVQDGAIVVTPELPLQDHNPTTAHIPLLLGIAANDGASFSTLSPAPITNLSAGLQLGLSISAEYADAIIASGLFPFYDSGNLTLDAFNVTQRVATDNTFRCIDQATAYAGAVSGAFRGVWFYQFERSKGGYNPNNLGKELTDGPVSEGFPRGDPASKGYFRLHGSTGAWIFGNWGLIAADGEGGFRDETDLWSVQLGSAYFAAFVRRGDPNPGRVELGVRGRGYERVLEAVEGGGGNAGRWEEVRAGEEGGEGAVRFLDWPSRSGGFVDLEQCGWLNYSLGYYLEGEGRQVGI